MATDTVGKYKAVITPVVEDGGVGKDIEKEIGTGVNKAGRGIGSKLGTGLKIGAAAGIAAVGAGIAGLGALTSKALSAQAEIQQSLGGSEAVFEQNAGAVQEWAAAAAGSMGISTNAALETANKMGSLFQGSGIGIQESAEMTMNMSKRAADVASIMGVDLESAMEAVTGAAKGNFTMMDNLGVAMNATTLEAYAASKGIDATWNSMSNAEKTGLAYQMFMEKTSKYAGNFEKENRTLQGSLDILGASWENLFYSLGDADMLDAALGQMKDAIVNVVTSISEVLPTLLTNMGTMITELVPILLDSVKTLLPQIAAMLATELPKLIDSVGQALPGMIEVLVQTLDTLLPVVLTGIVSLANALIAALPALIDGVLDTLISFLPQVIDSAVILLNGIVEALPLIITSLTTALPMLITALTTSLVKAQPELGAAAYTLLGAIINQIPAITGALIASVGAMIVSYVAQWFANIPRMKEVAGKAFGGILDAFNNVAWALDDALRTFFSKIPGWISAALAGIKDIGGDIVRGIWEGMKNMGGWFGNQVKSWGSGIVSNIKGFFGIHSPSRLMRDEIGKEIGAGVGVGLLQSSNKVLKDAQRFNETISSGIDITGKASLDYGNEGIYASTHGQEQSSVIINQTVEQPKNMMDMYLVTRRAAVQGTAIAGGTPA